jgi:hypothetical protein
MSNLDDFYKRRRREGEARDAWGDKVASLAQALAAWLAQLERDPLDGSQIVTYSTPAGAQSVPDVRINSVFGDLAVLKFTSEGLGGLIIETATKAFSDALIAKVSTGPDGVTMIEIFGGNYKTPTTMTAETFFQALLEDAATPRPAGEL